MKRKIWLFSCIFPVLLLSQLAEGAEVKYTSIEPLTDQHLSLRDTWDKTGQFCYLEEGVDNKKCLNITKMGEIKIREKGNWSQEPQDKNYIAKLSAEEVAVAEKFYKLYVRYLAVDNSNQFVVHIFFLKRPGEDEREDMSQTLFEFGDIQGGEVHVNSMSFSNGLEVFGAALSAGVSLSADGVKPTEPLIYAEMVNSKLPLLNVGAKVVKIFINSNPNEERLP